MTVTGSRVFTASTTTAAELFPFVAGSGTPKDGVLIGRHLLWGERVHLDPFAWLATGLTTNTGMFQIGQPGTGKSAFAKRQILGMAARGARPVILGDPKGEYSALIEQMGGQVLRVGAGHDRINPLDAHGGADARQRRLSMLLALCALARGAQPVGNGEEVVLAAAIDAVSNVAQPTLADVLAALRNPPDAVVQAAEVRGMSQYDEVTQHLRWTLRLLLEGSLAGVFDGPSTQAFDAAAPAVAVDLSGVDDPLQLAATMLSSWAWGQEAVARASAAGSRWLVVMDELWRALRGGPAIVEHVDALTRLGRSRGVASLMITHSLNDLRAMPRDSDIAKAVGFIDRSAIVVLSGLPRRELQMVSEVVALTRAEQDLVASWASARSWRNQQRHPGRGKYLIKTGHRPGLPVDMRLTVQESRLYNTDPRVIARSAPPETAWGSSGMT